MKTDNHNTERNTGDTTSIPLVDIAGNAYECGCIYTEICQKRYPGETYYLANAVKDTQTMSSAYRYLFATRAPYLPDIWQGITDTFEHCRLDCSEPVDEECTSFAVHGTLTRDGMPVSGQTKDNPLAYADRYIVLRMRITGGPSILVLTYPGELLGYGLWSTGMSLFRNDLKSSAGAAAGLTLQQWGLLALACDSAGEAAELACMHGITGAGNVLICDIHGDSLNVEFNAGGVSIIPAANGISVHANHPVGKETSPFEHYEPPVEKDASRFRMARLRTLLEAERKQLTVDRIMTMLADHEGYPRGICRHMIGNSTDDGTTAAIIAEPSLGRLHVRKGHPCCNSTATYTLKESDE